MISFPINKRPVEKHVFELHVDTFQAAVVIKRPRAFGSGRFLALQILFFSPD